MTPTPVAATETIILAPSYRIPLVLLGLGALLGGLSAWAGGAVALLGLLLLVQAITLRLHFSQTALEIYRGQQQIRQFPYQDWLNWQIFWQPVPILLYFKEVKSIHFLPIIFSPSQLQSCLEQRCPRPGQIS